MNGATPDGATLEAGAEGTVFDLDTATLADPELARCPYAFYRELRREDPVHVDPVLGYTWITRREDVIAAQQDSARFSSNSGLQLRSKYRSRAQKLWDEAKIEVRFTLLTADPPEHEEYRRFGIALFPPKKVVGMASYLEKVINELIDSFVDQGECDFLKQFGTLLPATIVSDEYGFPREERAKFKHWADGIIQLQTPNITEDEEVELVGRVIELFNYLKNHIKSASDSSKGRVIYDLATFTRRDGSPFTLLERAWMAMVIFIAGNDTTAGLLTSSINVLASRHDIQDILRSDPAKIENFVEEMLRYEGSVQSVVRVAKTDIELQGKVIPAGSDIMVCNASGNRDETYWEAPDEFLLDRPNARQHLGFGNGRHVCVGMHLARLEMSMAIRILLERLGNIRFQDTHNPPKNMPMAIFRGFETMPIRFNKLR